MNLLVLYCRTPGSLEVAGSAPVCVPAQGQPRLGKEECDLYYLWTWAALGVVGHSHEQDGQCPSQSSWSARSRKHGVGAPRGTHHCMLGGTVQLSLGHQGRHPRGIVDDKHSALIVDFM